MTNFFKKLVDKFPVLAGGNRAPRANLGAFGKHPRWDDHIDPVIGIEGALIHLRQILYWDGIRDRAIAAWRKTPAEHLIPLNHLLVWQIGSNEYICARVWHSHDGRGRDDFPMVVAAQCSGITLAWLMAHAAPLLEDAEARIKEAGSKNAVASIIESARESLRASISTATSGEDAVGGRAALGELLACADLGNQDEAILRVLHVLQDLRDGESEMSALHLRVPRCAAGPAEAILIWSRALIACIGKLPQCWLIAPLSDPWVDIFVGSTDGNNFIAIRNSLKTIPLTTDIAYNLSPALLDRAGALLQQAREAVKNTPAELPVPLAR